MTDSRSDSESTPSKPRGLWSLMGSPTPNSAAGSDQSTESGKSDDQSAVSPLEAKASDVEPTSKAAGTSEPASPNPRGLWQMMRQPASDPLSNERAESVDEDEPPTELPKTEFPSGTDGKEPRSPAPRSLFALMGRANVDGGAADPAASTQPDKELESAEQVVTIRRSASLALPDDPVSDAEVEELTDEDLVEENANASQEGDSPSLATGVIDPEELEPPYYRVAAAKAKQQGRIAALAGITAISASALSLLPSSFAGLPATVLGFIAIISGYLSVTGTGRTEISAATRAGALLGMVAGTIGIFLGPLFFTSLGRHLREPSGHHSTREHVTRIGEGLDRHYTQHKGYPIGGVFARDDAGVIRGQHGWMTFLLPFIGETELYQQIDQSRPFDHPLNQNPMGQNVDLYFAEGGDRSRVGKGFAASHFAGVGGEVSEDGRILYLGIFERDVAVKREEITDGLSNTLIVGELAGSYPPWGEPENWREIGRGLNKDPAGFGSADGNGAVFLLADGSVKFFSNKTSPKVLEKMTTRNGAD